MRCGLHPPGVSLYAWPGHALYNAAQIMAEDFTEDFVNLRGVRSTPETS
jgi:hypothetical protein